MRIAIIFKDNLNGDLKGQWNAVLNRTKSLQALGIGDEIQPYIIQFYHDRLFCRIHRIKQQSRPDKTIVDGLSMHILWVKIPFLTIQFYRLLSKKMVDLEAHCLKKYSMRFKNFDIISAHSRYGGLLGRAVAKRYNIPFFVTWHGTDIHTAPFQDSHIFTHTKLIMQDATCNFFVSRNLMELARQIIGSFKGVVLYNAASRKFRNYSVNERHALRKQFGIGNKKTVAFCGNVIDVKNVEVLPQIFKRVEQLYNKPIFFLIVGDGNKRAYLEQIMHQSNKFFLGNVSSEMMPDIMNCIDVLVLPSLNEGLGIVTIEALACGANVVGSRVGGIPEVIGMDNTFPLDSNFIESISKRIVEMLHGNVSQTLDSVFDWRKTAEKEMSIYKSCIQS